MNTDTDKIIHFTILYNQYKVRLYNYLLKMSNCNSIAEDITQNTFLKLYENYNNIRDKESSKFWLFKTARNEFYTYYNQNKKLTGIDESFIEQKDDYELENYVELKEIKQIIMHELNKMSNEQKEVYLLKEYGGLSYKEIAETLNLEINLIKSRLYKVRQKLIGKISKLV